MEPAPLTLPKKFRGSADDVAVKAAAEATVARYDQDLELSPLAFLQERMGEAVDALTQIAEYPAHFVRIGTGGQDAIL